MEKVKNILKNIWKFFLSIFFSSRPKEVSKQRSVIKINRPSKRFIKRLKLERVIDTIPSVSLRFKSKKGKGPKRKTELIWENPIIKRKKIVRYVSERALFESGAKWFHVNAA